VTVYLTIFFIDRNCVSCPYTQRASLDTPALCSRISGNGRDQPQRGLCRRSERRPSVHQGQVWSSMAKGDCRNRVEARHLLRPPNNATGEFADAGN